MKSRLFARAWKPVYANDNDAFIPEIWANESLIILQNQMVMGNLVHRDFSDEVANFGDVVNTRRPNDFTGKRKTDADTVTVQDAVSPNVAVKLDQHLHVSFLIKDGEESKSFMMLRDVYLEPALNAIAQSIDEILTTQVYRFLANVVGQIGTTPTRKSVIDVREKLNELKAPMTNRNLVVTTATEGDLLNIQDFINAEKVGDDGTALREGSVGRKFGLNIVMDQNTPSVGTGNSTVTPDVNIAAGHPIGTTAIIVDGGVTVVAGSWCTIAGDDTPQLITAVDADPALLLTIEPGLRFAVADDAVVTVVSPGALNFGAGLPIGHTGELVIDGFTVSPKKGQLVSFKAAGVNKHGIIVTPDGPDTTSIDLDRALAEALVDDDVVAIGPAGEFNFGFHKNALTLVTRPLAAPASGTGALSSVQSANGIGVRIVITYDGDKQGHLVTVDLLAGVEVLDVNLGVPLLA